MQAYVCYSRSIFRTILGSEVLLNKVVSVYYWASKYSVCFVLTGYSSSPQSIICMAGIFAGSEDTLGPGIITWMQYQSGHRCHLRASYGPLSNSELFIPLLGITIVLLLRIAFHCPCAITCWYSDIFMVVSDRLVMLWLKDSKIPTCDNDFWIRVSYMTHCAVIVDQYDSTSLQCPRKQHKWYAL